MDIFIEVKKNLNHIGLLEMEQSKKPLLQNMFAALTFAAIFYAAFTTLWYFIFEAENLEQYTESLPMTDAFIYVLTLFCLYLSGRRKMLQLIEALQSIIRQRMVKAESVKVIYEEINERIERASRMITMLLFRVVVPFYVGPPLLQSYYAYYMENELAEIAFRLPVPAS